MNNSPLIIILAILLTFFSMAAISGEVTIVDAKVNKTAEETYNFSVKLKHTDTGWDHYANRWQILTPEHQVLGTRTLHHPHVNEQPFTRSLGGVKIPADVSTIIIQARDSVHGVGAQKFILKLP